MRFHWWKSIRWRLALGSVCVVLTATLLLALAALFAVRYFYVDELQGSLQMQAGDHARELGIDYAYNLTKQSSRTNQSGSTANQIGSAWSFAINRVLKSSIQPSEQSKSFVIDRNRQLIYPVPSNHVNTSVSKIILSIAYEQYTRTDQSKLSMAIRNALDGHVTNGVFGHRLPQDTTQPFSVVPIFYDGIATDGSMPRQPIGALVVTQSTAMSSFPFVTTVALWVFAATLIIVALAAIIAIIFARTITRPLAHLTVASRVLAQGNYDTQVSANAPGEIGELARSFNEMATQLKRDVDELHRQEQWRRELIMNITHDLATPLTAIAGLGEALVDGIGQSREDYEATGRIIMNETLRLRRLVQDLHVMAKVEAGALAPKKKFFRLAALVDQVFATMITEFERHQVEPVNEIPYNLPMLPADPDMLTRVFANLFSNALRHTPKGGAISVRVIWHDREAIVSVVDTGEGIPEDALPRIFERFYRADNARQSATGGSGLGLAIVQAIVEAHSGKIWAENVQGGGASISFTLPVVESNSESVPDMPTLPLFPEGVV
jgi:signal transduction histidine kinase